MVSLEGRCYPTEQGTHLSSKGRFAPKQIKTPQTVLGVTKDREPGRPRRVWCRLVPSRENASHHIHVDGKTEGQSDLLRDPWTPPARVPLFHVDDAAMTSWPGSLGPGFVGVFDEKSQRYFRWISARWRLNSVDGLRTIAERSNRPGRMKSAHRPATTRSEARSLGDRFRERLRISSWCLTSTDSATTERAPPGPASRATVASRCRNRTARSRTAQS